MFLKYEPLPIGVELPVLAVVFECDNIGLLPCLASRL